MIQKIMCWITHLHIRRSLVLTVSQIPNFHVLHIFQPIVTRSAFFRRKNPIGWKIPNLELGIRGTRPYYKHSSNWLAAQYSLTNYSLAKQFGNLKNSQSYSLFRHFVDAVEFMDDALSNNGKVFVNCVYGKSRSTSFVVVYLMLCHGWTALDALRHIRKKRPVQLNPGFLLQIVDLDYKLKWQRVSNT